MSHEYYLDCMDKGLKLYWRTLAKARGLELHTGDIEWVKSVPRGGAERIFNISLSHEGIEGSIKELIAKIQEGKAPSGILITPSSKPDNIADILSKSGFSVDYGNGSCMAMDLDLSIKHIEFDENIEVIPIKDESTLKVWTNIVNTALFEEDLFSYKQFHDLFMLDNTYFYLGLYNGQPASTCMAITEDDISTIEMVSTLKEYRRKGLGKASVVNALQKMQKKGVNTAVLRAEKEAASLYRSIGFIEFYKRIVADYKENN